MIRAIKGDTSARFTDGVWRTGIPQKAGWVAENQDQSSKIIPREIVDLSNAQKERIVATVEPTVPGVTVIPEVDVVQSKNTAVMPEATLASPVKKKVGAVAATKGKGNGRRKQTK